MECTLSVSQQSPKNLIGMVQEYNIDILAIKEIRWMGQSILEKRKVMSIIAAIINCTNLELDL
jgi:hypothetical protein